MNKIITIFITFFLVGSLYSQTDNKGNPIFNSISIGEKSFDRFLLISNYYTINNNIENKRSSVYVSEKPTLDEIEKFAIDLSSDFFIMTKDSRVIAMIMLQNKPKREFMTITMSNHKQKMYPCNLKGDITENRANELIQQKYDATATIKNNILVFNKKEFKIISNEEIEKAVLELIKNKKLDKKKPSDMIIPSKKELEAFVLNETKEGGKLDFFTEIKGKEYDGVQIKQGVFTTKESIALYKWGRANFDIGVNTIEDAYSIFSKFKSRKLNEKERTYIKMGFKKEWEK